MEDVDELHRLWTDPLVRRYLWDDETISPARAASEVVRGTESFRSRGFGQWTISLSGQQAIIGFCGLRLFGEADEIELLYGLAPAYWGRGLATEAAREMLRHAFDDLGLGVVLAGADPPNGASLRVLEKLGFRFSRCLLIGGVETPYFSISREEFQSGGPAARPG